MQISDVFRAQKRIGSIAKKTPVFRASSLDRVLGTQLYLKAENMQKTGSFKVRGAANLILKRVENSLETPGVVTASSGNHGQAVAYVASITSLPAIIVMPEGASPAKVNAARGYGAEVVFSGSTSSERLNRAAEIAKEQGYIMVPPYDHEDIIAGQGTVGIEIIDQLDDVEVIFVPIGGGGLTAGVVFTIKQLRPDVQVIGVEPENSNSMSTSIKRGERTELASTHSIADGLLTLIPGNLTFELVKSHIDDVVLVSESEIVSAMKMCLERFKLLPEPSGAVSIAAACGSEYSKGKKTVAIVSGGNMDLSLLSRYLETKEE